MSDKELVDDMFKRVTREDPSVLKLVNTLKSIVENPTRSSNPDMGDNKNKWTEWAKWRAKTALDEWNK